MSTSHISKFWLAMAAFNFGNAIIPPHTLFADVLSWTMAAIWLLAWKTTRDLKPRVTGEHENIGYVA